MENKSYKFSELSTEAQVRAVHDFMKERKLTKVSAFNLLRNSKAKGYSYRFDSKGKRVSDYKEKRSTRNDVSIQFRKLSLVSTIQSSCKCVSIFGHYEIWKSISDTFIFEFTPYQNLIVSFSITRVDNEFNSMKDAKKFAQKHFEKLIKKHFVKVVQDNRG